jgi:hypothetical protein
VSARFRALALRLDDLARAVGIEPRDYDRHSALGDVRMIRDAEDVITRRAMPS